MKTIAEKLDDLKAKLEKSKDIDEVKTILAEIDEINADAVKVVSALDKATKEAKDSRESKEELETENTELKEKLEKSTKTPEEIAAKKKALEDKEKDNTMPDWFKPYADDFEKSKQKEKTDEQAVSVKSKIEKALDAAKYPKSLSKFFHVKDFEKLDDEVSAFVQDLNNEDLKDVIVPKRSDDNNGAVSETIKSYAESKNKPSESTEISGKELET